MLDSLKFDLEMEPGHGSPGHRVSDFARVGSGRGHGVSVSDPVFDPL